MNREMGLFKALASDGRLCLRAHPRGARHWAHLFAPHTCMR